MSADKPFVLLLVDHQTTIKPGFRWDVNHLLLHIALVIATNIQEATAAFQGELSLQAVILSISFINGVHWLAVAPLMEQYVSTGGTLILIPSHNIVSQPPLPAINNWFREAFKLPWMFGHQEVGSFDRNDQFDGFPDPDSLPRGTRNVWVFYNVLKTSAIYLPRTNQGLAMHAGLSIEPQDTEGCQYTSTPCALQSAGDGLVGYHGDLFRNATFVETLVLLCLHSRR